MLTAIKNLRAYGELTDTQLLAMKRGIAKQKSRKQTGSIGYSLLGRARAGTGYSLLGGASARGKGRPSPPAEFRQRRAVRRLQHRWRLQRDGRRGAEVLTQMHVSATLVQKHSRGGLVRQGLVRSVKGRAKARAVRAERQKRSVAALLIQRRERACISRAAFGKSLHEMACRRRQMDEEVATSKVHPRSDLQGAYTHSGLTLTLRAYTLTLRAYSCTQGLHSRLTLTQGLHS